MEDREFERLLAPIDDLLLNVISKKVKNREAAMEIYHEVIILGMVHFHKLRDKRCFAPWMLTIARNAVNSHFKKEKKRQAREHVMDYDDPVNTPFLRHASAGFEDAVIARDEERRLHKAIESLETEERMVILMNYHGRMRLSEIAEELGMKVSSVKLCKRRALKKLRIFLEN